MIEKEALLSLKMWFADYVKTFHSADPEKQQNINIKKEHTIRVCSEIIGIAKSLGLSREEIRLAEAMALLHDVGRFEQYTRYGTFSDLNSENHAVLGIKILHENNILKGIDQSTRKLIFCAIFHHNRIELPKRTTEACLFFTKLLRDADKLDICQVLTDYYCNKNKPRNESIELGLPDTPEISEKVCQQLLVGRPIKQEYLKSLNDFKLLLMGWVYDVNFPRTFQLIRERGYLEMIRDALPPSERVLEIYSTIRTHLEKEC
ncbi:MAG: HD domain-containing protein [Candidatus Aminicenantes bacterium]|nr:HD domain-containing protein [Candidatus Aminicenantes bacterium]